MMNIYGHHSIGNGETLNNLNKRVIFRKSISSQLWESMLRTGNNERWTEQSGSYWSSLGFLEGSRGSGGQMNETHFGCRTNDILRVNRGGTKREKSQIDNKQTTKL